MSKRTKRGLIAAILVAFGACLALGVVWFQKTHANQEVPAGQLDDIGVFKFGSALGEERAGFSGRTRVIVLTSAREVASLSGCLRSLGVEAHMAALTGVLVDTEVEPEVESDLRERENARVVVKGLEGQILGVLREGYSCDELAQLLEAVTARMSGPPRPSPIYMNLLERPADVARDFVSRGEAAVAAKYVQLLEELEGTANAAVQAARGELAK